MRSLRLMLLSVLPMWAMAQSVDVAQVQHIIQTKCVNCHSVGNMAPFAFKNQVDLIARKEMIKLVVESGQMPPWKADNSYATYKHIRSLSVDEKATLMAWIAQPTGTFKLNQGATKSEKLAAGHKWLEIPVQGALSVPPSAQDTTIVLEIPFNRKRTENVVSLQFKASDLSYMHHVNIFIFDRSSKKKPGAFNAMGTSGSMVYLFGWAPGNTEFRFNEGVGFELPDTGMIAAEVHFSATPVQLSPTVGFAFALSDQKINRSVEPVVFNDNVFELLNSDSLYIPANTKKTIRAKYTVKSDKTLITLAPHMHIFGQNFEAYSVFQGDTTPLVKIGEWDPMW